MSTTNSNGHGRRGELAGARPVMLVRYRPGVTGETARTVHLVSLPTGGKISAVNALCGTLLRPADIESVTPGEGMPCMRCTLRHVACSDPPPPDIAAAAQDVISGDAGLLAAGATYRAWGWPVMLDRDQIRLSLDRDAVALIIPTPLATEVTQILTRRRSAPAVLAHPYVPEHRILLAGEPFGVALPWPPDVHQITGTLLLPPTVTPRGPLTWVHPPQPTSLRLCREIDLLGALRTALTDPPRPDHKRRPSG